SQLLRASVDLDNNPQVLQSFEPIRQKRTAETGFNQSELGCRVVKDCTLLIQANPHVNGNSYCSHGNYGNESFNKLRRIMKQQRDTLARNYAKSFEQSSSS